MNSAEDCTDERKVVVVSVVVRKVDLLCVRGRGARIPHRHHVVGVHAHDPETADEDALEAEAGNFYGMLNERFMMVMMIENKGKLFTTSYT